MTDMSTPPAPPVQERPRLSEPRAIIALMLIAAAIVDGGVLMVVPVPAANAHLIDLSFGWLLGAATTAVAYWLGSSKGSADKTAALVGKTGA